MHYVKITYVVISMLLLCLSRNAVAANEVMTIQIVDGGTVEVVVSGLLFDDCANRVNPPIDIVSTGSHFYVTSPNPLLPACVIPLDPPQPYSVVAQLGVLDPGSYSVTWVQSLFFNSTINFSVSATPQVISTTGVVGIIAMVFGILLAVPFNYTFKPSVRRRFHAL